jgi:hypothetical protein
MILFWSFQISAAFLPARDVPDGKSRFYRRDCKQSLAVTTKKILAPR